MNVPVLTFFNNKGGVGKTSLVYHLSWMYTRLRKRIVAVDLDPQANLTAAFLDEDSIERIWNDHREGTTIHHCLKPLMGVGDVVEPQLQNVATDLFLLPGDVELSSFEETLSAEWPASIGDNDLFRRMRIQSAFWHVMQGAAAKVQADLVLVDIGSNLGAINRSALIGTDHVVIPLGADLFSLQGLKNLGPSLRSWRQLWKKRLDNWKGSASVGDYAGFELPQGRMMPAGYLCQQHGVHLDRPVRADDKWVNRIPAVYREFVLEEPIGETLKPSSDPYCLATIKHYRSLVPMGQEHRKPIFDLSTADGAIGSHAGAVRDAKQDFKQLATTIADKIGLLL